MDSTLIETGSAAHFPRRYTTIKVIAYCGILQSIYSLVQFAYTCELYRQNWQVVVHLHWPWQTWALYGISGVGAIFGLVAHVALAFRRAWGRTLLVWVTAICIALSAVLPSRLMLLFYLPQVLVSFALLYNRLSSDFLHSRARPKLPGYRSAACFACFAVSCALHFWAMSTVTIRAGLLVYLLPQLRPLDLLVPAAVLLVAGIALSTRGKRAWNCGMTLMVFSVAMCGTLVTCLSIGTSLVRYMPAPFQRVSIPWNTMTMYTGVAIGVAYLLLQSGRPPRRNGPPLTMPDFL